MARSKWCLLALIVLAIGPIASGGHFYVQSQPALQVAPGELAFEASEGGPSPAPQSLTIRNSGGGLLEWRSSCAADWVIADSSGILQEGQSTSLQVPVLPDGLAVGHYEAEIRVIAEGATGSPALVLVTLDITSASGPALIEIDTSALTFQATEGDRDPPAQTVLIRNRGERSLTWSANVDVHWLSVEPSRGTLDPGDRKRFSVSVAIAGLSSGSHTGHVSVTSPDAANSPQTLRVNLLIEPSRPQCGSIIYSDDFSDSSSGWDVDSGQGFDWAYTNDGQYRVFITAPNYIAWSWAPFSSGRMPADFCLEVDVKQHVAGSLSEDGQIGLIFAGNETERTFTQLALRPSRGLFGMWQIGEGWEWTRLQGWTESDAVRSINAVNRIRLIAHDGQAHVYINDVEVITLSTATRGDVGVCTATFDEPNVNGRFDNFTIRELQ